MGAGAVRGQQPDNDDTKKSSRSSHHSSGSSTGGSGSPAANRRPQTNNQRKHPPPARANAKHSGQSNADSGSMLCDACNVNFTLFKRKKTCAECGRPHCSACLVKEPRRPSSQLRCSKCHLLSSGNFTRSDLSRLEVRDLRAFLARRSVPTVLCTEKNDLIELVLAFSNSSQHLREQRASQEHTAHLEERMRQHQADSHTTAGPERHPSQASHEAREEPATDPVQPREESRGQGPGEESEEERRERLLIRQQEEMQATEARLHDELQTEEEDPRPRRKHASIDELREEGDIVDLSVRQLKEILATNHVDYKGCVEKCELVTRVKRLWSDNQINRNKYMETGGEGYDGTETDLCKVCMDAVVDCVLLECGHMLTCTKCGRKLSECPICRQYVVRVVHTFRA